MPRNVHTMGGARSSRGALTAPLVVVQLQRGVLCVFRRRLHPTEGPGEPLPPMFRSSVFAASAHSNKICVSAG